MEDEYEKIIQKLMKKELSVKDYEAEMDKIKKTDKTEGSDKKE